jgi:hypothetical protein
MPSVTQEQIAALVKLQTIEIEISSIKAKLSSVDQRYLMISCWALSRRLRTRNL